MVCIMRGAGTIHILVPITRKNLHASISDILFLKRCPHTRSAVVNIVLCTEAGRSRKVVIFEFSPSYITMASFSAYGHVFAPSRT